MAVGRVDAPFLIVMEEQESVATERWLFNVIEDDCGVRRTDCRIVYLLDEPPAGASGAPTKTQVAAAAPRVRHEIEASSPAVIVAMGPYVFRAITGLTAGIEDARGYVLSMRGTVAEREMRQVGNYATRKPGKYNVGDPKMKLVTVQAPPAAPAEVPLIATYSPKAVEKSGYKNMWALKRDLQRAADVSRAACRYDDDNFWYHEDLEGLGESDYGGDLLAFDIETAGKNSTVVTQISFSDGHRTHTLRWNEEVRAWSQRQFDLAVSRGVLLVGHNLMFDIPILTKAGIVFSEQARLYDTMFGGVQLQPDLFKGLGRMAPLYLNLREPWKWEEIKTLSEEHYSAKDSFITALLAHRQIVMMKEIGWYDRFVDVIMQRVKTLMRLGAGGIRVDETKARAWRARLAQRLNRYTVLWFKSFPGVNPFSTPQLTKLLYRELGMPIQRSKKGSLSVDELACVNLKEAVKAGTRDKDTPWEKDPRITPRVFDLLLAMRRESKELKTYAKIQWDERGRVYPQYLPESKDFETGDGSKRRGAAATGRLASRGPNLQNQSKKAKEMYVPDEPDWCFIQWDYVAAELYVLAARSGDTSLMRALGEGGIHQKNADAIGCAKRTAKAVFYGSCFGAGAPKISETIMKEDHVFVSVAECRRVQKELHRLYPRAFAFLNSLGTLSVEQGYLVNAFGRVRFFYGRTRDIPAAKDYDSQSTVADIVWDVMGDMERMLREMGGRLTTTTHDSFLGQVHKSKVRETAQRGKEIMERLFENVAPKFFIPVEVEVAPPGGSWGMVAKEGIYAWDGADDS